MQVLLLGMVPPSGGQLSEVDIEGLREVFSKFDAGDGFDDGLISGENVYDLLQRVDGDLDPQINILLGKAMYTFDEFLSIADEVSLSRSVVPFQDTFENEDPLKEDNSDEVAEMIAKLKGVLPGIWNIYMVYHGWKAMKTQKTAYKYPRKTSLFCVRRTQ